MKQDPKRPVLLLCIMLVLILALPPGAGTLTASRKDADRSSGGQGTRDVDYQLDTSTGAVKKTYIRFTGRDEDDRLGGVLTSGDFNGDGKDDIILFTTNYYTPYREIWIIYGAGKKGLNATLSSTESADVKILGKGFETYTRDSVAIGDFDNDGRDDIAVFGYGTIGNKTAPPPADDDDDVQPPPRDRKGDPDPDVIRDSLPDPGIYLIFGFQQKGADNVYVLEEDVEHLFLGYQQVNYSIQPQLCAGDLNGDGYEDIIVDADYSPDYYDEYYDDGYYDDDEYYDKSPPPVEGTRQKDVSEPSDPTYNEGDGALTHILPGGQREALANYTVFGAADTASVSYGSGSWMSWGGSFHVTDWDGDGVDDLWIGDPFYDEPASDLYAVGRADLLLGTNTITPGSVTDLYDSAEVSITGVRNYLQTGSHISSGDLNGDGFKDLALVNLEPWENEPLAYVVYGGDDLSGSKTIKELDALRIYTGGQAWGYDSTCVFGDIDHDGIDDLVIGVPYYSVRTENVLLIIPTFRSDCGAVFTIQGSRDLGDQKIEMEKDGMHAVYGEKDGSYFGTDIVLADLDGDGRQELVAGAPGYTPKGESWRYDHGAVYVFFTMDIIDPSLAPVPSESNTAMCIIPVVIVTVVLVAILVLVLFLKRKKKKLQAEVDENGAGGQQAGGGQGPDQRFHY